MPYVRKGNRIYKKLNGKLELVQTCTSAENARKALNVRRAVEHNPDWKPTGRKPRARTRRRR